MKETIRATVHSLPYKCLPWQLIHALVDYSTNCWNAFPIPDGISPTISPNTMLLAACHATIIPILAMEFGSYALLMDCTTNTPCSCAFGTIALTQTGNHDNSYRFLSLLVTGEIVTKAPGYWTEVPISDAVIACVEAMAL